MPYPVGIEHIGPRRLDLLSSDTRLYAAGEPHPLLDPEIEHSGASRSLFQQTGRLRQANPL